MTVKTNKKQLRTTSTYSDDAAEPSLDAKIAAVKAVHPNAHIANNLGIVVVIAGKTIIGSSGLNESDYGWWELAWNHAYERLPTKKGETSKLRKWLCLSPNELRDLVVRQNERIDALETELAELRTQIKECK